METVQFIPVIRGRRTSWFKKPLVKSGNTLPTKMETVHDLTGNRIKKTCLLQTVTYSHQTMSLKFNLC